jgi:hypothetical protein
MRNITAFMTQTTQARSSYSIKGTEKKTAKDKPQTECNMELMMSVISNIDDLYKALSGLNDLIQRKNMERILRQKSEGGNNEN